MATRPRIGIDCRMYSSKFTGIGRYVYELVHHLTKIDTKHDFVLFFNEPEFSEFIPPNEHVIKVNASARHYSLAEQTIFLYKVLKEKLDLMHFTHFNAPILYKKKSVVTIHDLTLSFFPGNKMRSPVYRAAYKIALRSATHNASKIITVSHNTAKDLQKSLEVDAHKIHVIYEGVNENFKPASKKSTSTSTRPPYILYTGVWRSHKNLVSLIKAFQILKDKYKEDVQLVITGREDPHYPEVKRTAAESGYESDIIFTGMLPEKELIDLYAGAHVYTLPSFYEGFGLSPLEAMQSGVPTVVSKTSCLPEICGEENALFFDPYDPSDIAEKLHTACVNDEVRKKLIANGKEHVKKFSWEKMAHETLEVYNFLLKH